MLHRTLVPALMLTALIALLSLTGCAVVVAPVEDDPAQEPVGARQMVQLRSTAAAVAPTPPAPKEPEPPQPLDAVASSNAWTLLPMSAGTLAGGVLTSVPTCDAMTGAQSTQGATAELTIGIPWKGNGCAVKLGGDLGLLRLATATLPRQGTNFTCEQRGDAAGWINIADGGGWGESASGNVKLPPNALYFSTLTSSIGIRFRLRGDSAAHLGEVSATIHCDGRL